MISEISNSFSRKVATILAIVAVTANNVQLGDATIVVISKTTNETVFSAEEIGIDAASAYNLMGTLIIADPIDACSEVKPPPTKSNHTIIVGAITGQLLVHKESWILWAIYNYTDDSTCVLSKRAKEAEYAGYSAIIVTVLCLSHYLYMRVSSSVQERRRKRKAFLTESQLKKLPVLHWRTSIPQDTCSICIENFEVGEEIRVLPCSHVFHKPCIDPWLIHSSRRCPNCKGKVIFPNEHFSDSSNSDSDSHLEDSDDDLLSTERTPLLLTLGESEIQIEDTRFVETQANARQGQSSSSSNALSTNNTEHEKETAKLIDISSDNEEIPDESFGLFQSAHTVGKDEALLVVDADCCSQSLASAKSFDSDKTFTDNSNLKRKVSQNSSNVSRKNDDCTSSMGSNVSFFSCLESELEKSTASNRQHELFQSFQS